MLQPSYYRCKELPKMDMLLHIDDRKKEVSSLHKEEHTYLIRDGKVSFLLGKI